MVKRLPESVLIGQLARLTDLYFLGALCSVCKEDFTPGEHLMKLPCKHLYHKDCVIPWLELVSPIYIILPI